MKYTYIFNIFILEASNIDMYFDYKGSKLVNI